MLEQSKEYLAAVKSPQRQVDAKFTLNNRVYTGAQLAKLDNDQAIVSGTSYTFGGAYVAGLTVEIKELVEGLMEMMPATAEIGISVDDAMEYKPIGQFFVKDIELDRNTNSTKLKLQDGFCKLNGEYQSRLSYPTTARAVFSEICQICNISTKPMNIPDTIILGTKLEKTSYREAIQYIAQLVGSYAIFNRKGQLEFRNIQKLSYRVNRDNYVMGGFKRKEIQFRLNGIECEVSNNQKLITGTSSGNVAKLNNPWMTQMYLDELFSKVQGFQFYPYSLNFQGDPCLDVGDWIEVEYAKGEYFQAPILVQKISFDGGLSSEISANTLGVSDVVYQYKSPLARKVEFIEGRLSADGLSQVYSGLDEPNNEHLKKGDTWFRPNGTDIDILMWDGAKWEVRNSREKFDQLEQEFQEQEKYFDELKKKFEAQDKYFKELDAEFENSKQILDSAKADLDNAKIELETNKQSISANEQLIQQSNEEMVEMRKKFNTIDNSISNFNESIRAHELSLTNLDDSVSTMNQTLANANNTLAGIENNYVKTAEYTRDTTNLKSRLTSVEGYGAKISTIEQTASNFRIEMAQKNNDQDIKYANLAQTVDGFKNTIVSVSNEQNVINSRISTLEQTDTAIKTSITAVDKRVDGFLYKGENILSSNYIDGRYSKNIKNASSTNVTLICNPGEDCYLYLNLSVKLYPGMGYSLSFDCSGVQSGDVLAFGLGGEESNFQRMTLKNGTNTNEFIHVGSYTYKFQLNNISLESKFDGTRLIELSNFVLCPTGLGNAVVTTNSNITQTADSIKSEVAQKVSGLDGRITSLGSTVTQTKNSIEQSISELKKDTNATLYGENDLVDNSKAIVAKRNVVANGMQAILKYTENVDTYFEIPLTKTMPGGIKCRIEFDCTGVQSGDVLIFGLGGESPSYDRVKLKNGHISQEFISNGSAGGGNYFRLDDVERTLASGTHNIVLENFKIIPQGLSNAIVLTNSNIKQTANGIRSDVTKQIQTVDGRVTTLGNSVDQTANSWAVKNIKNNNDIVSQINLTDDNVYIKGKNIWLDGTTRIEDAIIKTAHIQNGTITNAKIGDAAITTVKIENSSITSSKILDATITSAKIGYAQINGAHIQSASITNSKIATAAIGSAEIMDGAIINAKIANAAITDAKIQNGTITNASIRDATITSAKIAYIDAAKITTGTMSADRIYGGVLNAQNGAMRINLNSADITFNSSATIDFNSSWNAVKRSIGDSTGFLHFSDAAAGGVYVGLGVTSHNEGVKSQDTARFAGIRIFRSNDSVDQTEIYGDRIVMTHAFNDSRQLVVDPLNFSRGYKMSEIINSIKSLWRCWLHLNNVRWNSSDNNFGNAVINEYNSYNI